MWHKKDRKHFDLLLEILKHTDKPVNGFMTTGKQTKAQLDMMEIAMGGRGFSGSTSLYCRQHRGHQPPDLYPGSPGDIASI
jgi:trimethylamine:corrinoid methyltransferase-like protein